MSTSGVIEIAPEPPHRAARPATPAAVIYARLVLDWLAPALLIALFAWIRRDMIVFRREVRSDIADVRREVRSDIADARRDIADVRDWVSRLEGRIDGWQDRHHPPAA